MKIVLFEYMTGGGVCNQKLPSLAREGGMMLQMLGNSLAAIEGVTLLTMRDARLAPPEFDTEVIWVEEKQDFSLILSDALDALDQGDAFWPIAPEMAGTLAVLCQLAESKPIWLLNSPSSAVAKTTSKLQTYQHLRDKGVACVETKRLADCDFPCAEDRVIKPDDGLACEGCYVVLAGQLAPTDCPSNTVCQPLVCGVAASISVVYSATQACLISVNRQEVAYHNQRFLLRACEVNAKFNKRTLAAAKSLAEEVRQAFPDLRACVGIDFIVTDEGLQVLEINPRLTTSFVGLQEHIAKDVCALVLDAVQSKPLQCPAQGQPMDVRLDG